MRGAYDFKPMGTPIEIGDWEKIPLGHWARSEGGSVFLCCPECGLPSRLPHAVSAEGKVSPSVVCPYTKKEHHDPPCTMHLEPVTLMGWTFGAKGLN